MKNPMKTLVVATLSSLALAPFSAAALEKFLPGDTLALAKIENIDKLEQQSKTNPLAAELNAKIFTPFLAEVKADNNTAKEFSEFSATCAELAEIFSGEVLFAVVNRKGTLNPVILADCSGVADLEKVAELYKKSNPDATLEPVGVAGVDAMKSGKDCFTVVGKTFILSDDVDALKEFVRSIMTSSSVKQKKAKGKSLADSAEFNKARECIGDADFWFYADGK
ncbi:MAG: hypothetical protein IJY80_05835, partial [Opitutales bacterium]|nr:hypothetical protein [Opitutales bacterium]